MTIEPLNGYVIECQRSIIDEQGNEEKVSIFYRVNASSQANAYRFVQSFISELENMSIVGVTKEYQNRPFVGIML